jgi:hypothetical protein
MADYLAVSTERILHTQNTEWLRTQTLPQSQTGDRSSKRPSDRPSHNHLTEMWTLGAELSLLPP